MELKVTLFFLLAVGSFTSTQRGGHVSSVCAAPGPHRAAGDGSGEARGWVQEPGLHRLWNDSFRCVWSLARWLKYTVAAARWRQSCRSLTGALKTDHTEVLLSADFTGAIKVFINVKKYWSTRRSCTSSTTSAWRSTAQKHIYISYAYIHMCLHMHILWASPDITKLPKTTDTSGASPGGKWGAWRWKMREELYEFVPPSGLFSILSTKQLWTVWHLRKINLKKERKELWVRMDRAGTTSCKGVCQCVCVCMRDAAATGTTLSATRSNWHFTSFLSLPLLIFSTGIQPIRLTRVIASVTSIDVSLMRRDVAKVRQWKDSSSRRILCLHGLDCICKLKTSEAFLYVSCQ